MRILIQADYSQPTNAAELADIPLVINRRPTEEPNETLVILVHGLGGHRYGSKSSWGQFPNFLYEDFPAADLGLYSYRTRFGRLKFWESIPVEQEAEIFAHNLRDLTGYKNIILIAHSMGGLVALKAITYLVEMHAPREHKETLSRIKGLFLMASPQLGSQLAWFFRSLLWFNYDLRALATHSDLITRIDRSLHTNVHLSDTGDAEDKIRIPTWVVRASSDKLVSKLSSSVHLGEERIRTVHGQHGDIVKPPTKEDDAYIFVAERIRLCLTHAAMPPIGEPAELPENPALSTAITPEERIAQAQAALSMHLLRLARENGINASIDYLIAPPEVGLPPLVNPLTSRTTTVDSLKAQLLTNTWVSLYGTISTGKTQLANLVARAFDNYKAWIRFRELTPAQAELRLDEALSHIAGVSMQSDRVTWYNTICDVLGQDSLLVLDDLPRLTGAELFSGHIIQFALVCRVRGIRLLTISAYPLPHRIHAALDVAMLSELPVPGFNESDTRELLQAYGAPLTILTSEFATFVVGIARRHPMLVAAVAVYLKQRDWRVTREEIQGLFKSEHIAGMHVEIVQQILDNIQSRESRMLLYRLGLSLEALSIEDVMEIAAVDPQVDMPLERLQDVMGLWVQREANGRLLVSPLIAQLPPVNLSSSTRKSCHRVYAERIVSRERITAQQAVTALQHFNTAELFNQAGILLFELLTEVEAVDVPEFISHILSIWSSTPLPDEMDLGIKIYLRMRQIAARHKHGLATSYLADDFEQLMNEATPAEAWAVLGAVVATPVGPDSPVGAANANRNLLLALELLPDIILPNGEVFTPPAELNFESIVWWQLYDIVTVQDFRNWIGMLNQLTPVQMQRALKDPLAEDGCIMAADRIWLQESYKPEQEQDWQVVLQVLQELEACASQKGAELLWASAVRARVVIQAEYLRDLPAAVGIAENALTRASDDPRVQFLLRETLGKQSGMPAIEALPWLQSTLAQNTDVYPYLRLLTVLSASRVAGLLDSSLGVQYAQQAVELAEGSPKLHTYEDASGKGRIQASAELAIAHWLGGNINAAFAAWDTAAQRLLTNKSNTDDWRGLAALFGRITIEIVENFPVPPREYEGRPYEEVVRGIFLLDAKRASSYFDDTHEGALLFRLTEFANLVGSYERALDWGYQGLEFAKATDQAGLTAMLGPEILGNLLEADRFNDVFNLASELGPIFFAMSLKQQELMSNPNSTDMGIDLDRILGPRSSEAWRAAELSGTVPIGLIPMLFRLSALAITEPDRASACAQEVAILCQRQSGTSAHSPLWNTAARIIEGNWVERENPETIAETALTLGPEYFPIPQVFAFVALGFRLDTLPEEAIEHQLWVLPYVNTSIKPFSSTYRRVVTPCFESYWGVTFVAKRLRFSAPVLLQRTLDTIRTVDISNRVGVLLDAVAVSLRVGKRQ